MTTRKVSPIHPDGNGGDMTADEYKRRAFFASMKMTEQIMEHCGIGLIEGVKVDTITFSRSALVQLAKTIGVNLFNGYMQPGQVVASFPDPGQEYFDEMFGKGDVPWDQGDPA
jgi:hypothetical protein